MTPAAFVQAFAAALANDGALVLLVLLILWLGARKVWVWKWAVDRLEAQLTDERIAHMAEMGQLREERDQWRRLCLYQSGHAQPERPPPPNPLEDD